MNLDYADLISGDSIYISGAGHFHSPKLYELYPTKGIGNHNYKFYISLLAWNKDKLLDYARQIGVGGLKAFNGKENLTYFDIITLIPDTRSMLEKAIDFFIDEKIKWDDVKKSFIVYNNDDKPIGVINRNNYEDVANTILQLNYINLEEDKAPPKFTSNEAKDLWEKAQQYLKKQSQKKTEENPDYKLGNIISKLCCVHSSYNLLNIYNLTIFQLYDQFFQISYLRGVNLNDRIFSNHGGDDYKFENWLKPINQK